MASGTEYDDLMFEVKGQGGGWDLVRVESTESFDPMRLDVGGVSSHVWDDMGVFFFDSIELRDDPGTSYFSFSPRPLNEVVGYYNGRYLTVWRDPALQVASDVHYGAEPVCPQ